MRYTIELVNMNFYTRIPCSFCGYKEKGETRFAVFEDGKNTNWEVCDNCFLLFKTNPEKVIVGAINMNEERLKSVKESINQLEILRTQKIGVVGRKSKIPQGMSQKDWEKMIADKDKEYGDSALCKERCSNCDGNVGDMHLPECAEMYAMAEMK